jgi:Carbohydrate family 9 binding domain-like
MKYTVKKAEDFAVDGAGAAAGWTHAEWLTVSPIKGSSTYATRAKALYSATGFYCLFDCEDRKLTCTDLGDNANLWTEDVAEVFLWPDQRQTMYFEYEISPLGAELPILVPNQNGTFMGWLPWHYGGDRQVRRATTIRGGEKKPGAAVTGWSAEFFIPFALLRGLGNQPPTSGTQWRANFYRIDHDAGQTLFSWTPGIKSSFHEYDEFGTLVFE